MLLKKAEKLGNFAPHIQKRQVSRVVKARSHRVHQNVTKL